MSSRTILLFAPAAEHGDNWFLRVLLADQRTHFESDVDEVGPRPLI